MRLKLALPVLLKFKTGIYFLEKVILRIQCDIEIFDVLIYIRRVKKHAVSWRTVELLIKGNPKKKQFMKPFLLSCQCSYKNFDKSAKIILLL